ncbi:MAG TPA: cupin domain-containing protein [Hyphomonadaceae bacterium]|nr:cupin domain-containing protein [Hyphomonadaceae bacterium]
MIKVVSAPHIDETTRAALASGRAEPSLGLFIDTLMTMRGIDEPEGEIIAGTILEAEIISELSPHALDMVWAAIERGASRPKSGLVYEDLNQTPAFLQDAILAAEEHRGWAYGGPGIKRLVLDMPGDRSPRTTVKGATKIEIIRIDAGTKVPWHTHKGQELSLCLAGEFSDHNAVYGPGDFSVYDGATRHQPVATPNAPAYALVVTDDGLRFEGLLGALQKLFNA